jgi:hypothetical protein
MPGFDVAFFIADITIGAGIGVAAEVFFFASAPAPAFVPDDLPVDAFTLGDFAFARDGTAFSFSTDDGTTDLFLDLPNFIGGPRDLRLQRAKNIRRIPVRPNKNLLRNSTYANFRWSFGYSFVICAFGNLSWWRAPNFHLPAQTFGP